jgi:hypothetical protein
VIHTRFLASAWAGLPTRDTDLALSQLNRIIKRDWIRRIDVGQIPEIGARESATL